MEDNCCFLVRCKSLNYLFGLMNQVEEIEKGNIVYMVTYNALLMMQLKER